MEKLANVNVDAEGFDIKAGNYSFWMSYNDIMDPGNDHLTIHMSLIHPHRGFGNDRETIEFHLEQGDAAEVILALQTWIEYLEDFTNEPAS